MEKKREKTSEVSIRVLRKGVKNPRLVYILFLNFSCRGNQVLIFFDNFAIWFLLCFEVGFVVEDFREEFSKWMLMWISCRQFWI